MYFFYWCPIFLGTQNLTEQLFNKYQTLLLAQLEKANTSEDSDKAQSQTTTVIYGHDAATSLNIQRYTKGLDSGCVYGRKLTALVIGDDGKQQIVQVKCKAYQGA